MQKKRTGTTTASTYVDSIGLPHLTIIHARFILFNGGTEISIGLLFSIVV
jgi:hypothetical protein